jgi:hypothetical protein
MGDIPNVEKDRIVIEGPTGNDQKVSATGSTQVNLFDDSGAILLGQKAMTLSLPVVLASDHSIIDVQTRAEAAGANDRLFVLNSEITLGAAEEPLMLITNPGGSGYKILFQDLQVSCIDVGNGESAIRIYKTPTITANGTANSAKPIRVGATLPTSATNSYDQPTISSNGTRMYTFYITGGPASGGTYMYNFQSKFILDPGYSILLTGDADGTGRLIGTNIVWAEEAV